MAMTTEERNAKAKARMAAYRQTPEYQAWLTESRERRKALKAKYRRAAGAKTRDQMAADAAARQHQVQLVQAERQVARAQPDEHVRAWLQHCKQSKRKAVAKELRVPVERLRELLKYDPETGVLRWRVGYGKAVAGSEAGYLQSARYMTLGIDGEKFRAHRVAWALVYGEWPEHTIDHLDGDRCNNKLANLRCVPQAVNMQNIRKPTSRNTSGYLGVYWSDRRGGWMASVTTGGKQRRWGPYKTRERAYATYVARKRQYHEGCTL